MGLLDKIKQGLSKTREQVGSGLNSMFAVFRSVDRDFLDELLENLIIADIGYEVSEKIIEELEEQAKIKNIKNGEEIKLLLSDIIADKMAGDNNLNINSKPSIILIVGVNGVGKTTTIGKLANLLKNDGKKVIIAAADTFRAAAIEQIEIWAKRSDVDIIKHKEGSDPAAVIFDAIQAVKARGADVLICDTAGRLHTKKHLMAELSKILKVINRELPEADKDILLVLDATTGQNAISQAKDFKEAAEITGVVLTKLDGTAKGGVAISVKEITGVPIKIVCVGEQIDDMMFFDAKAYADAILGIE